MAIFPAPKILLVISFLFFVTKSVSDPRATEAALICSNKTANEANRQEFIANYLAAMESVSSLVSMQGYGGIENGTGNNKIYAFADCTRDLSRNDCVLCVELSKVQIHDCLPFQNLVLGGRIYFDGCFLRYDNYRFFGEIGVSDDGVVCGGRLFSGNISLVRELVVDLFKSLGMEGVKKNDGFFVGSLSRGGFRVYGLVQCWRYMRGVDCEKCLADSISKIGFCLDREEGKVLNSGCYLRYSTKKFYHDSESSSNRNGDQDKCSAIILAGTSAGVAIVLFVAAVSFFLRKQIVKQKREKEQLHFLSTYAKSKLIFSYETLEKATKYFHNSNRLGEGGSGHVYKGKLPDGRTVAIKRILFDTKQWVDHFFNEVNLISSIDHKNHVKLLGYSITGPESLLVYAYMPNNSLHDYFFVKKNVQPLKWEVRYKIILGTAEGLAYLHEESNLRIIHRDIKLNNILLDEDFTPKIADFGLARLFPRDKTHLSSAVAGTLGYMAPEYVFHGKLTEKVDVYSFGVLIIEILTGRRNNAFSENKFPVLQMVWNLYQKGKLCEAIDPLLERNFQEETVSRMLKLGLLCAQASAEQRPSMSRVVKMLINNQEIPHPTEPPFLNSSYV